MPSTITDRLNGLTTSVAVKAPCRVATTANITLSGEQTIDGVAVVERDRVLVKNQTSSVDNGIYVANSSAWVRAADFDGSLDVVNGTVVSVHSGTVNAGSYWRVTSSDGAVIGTDAITFAAGLISSAEAVVTLDGSTVQQSLDGYSTRTAIKALTAAVGRRVNLTESGREGTFVFRAGNFTTHIAADTQEGMYLKADGTAASAGAWVRQLSSLAWQMDWFAVPGDAPSGNGTTLCHTELTALINLANIVKPSRVDHGSKIYSLGAAVPKWDFQVGLFGARGAQGTIINKRYVETDAERGAYSFGDHGVTIDKITFNATAGSGGSLVSLITTLPAPAAGRTFLIDVYCSGANFVNQGLMINGMSSTDPSKPGHRGIWLRGGEYFGAAVAAINIKGAHHLMATGVFCTSTGGSGIALKTDGSSTVYNDDWQWHGVISGHTELKHFGGGNPGGVLGGRVTFTCPQIGNIDVSAECQQIMWTGPYMTGTITNAAGDGFVFTRNGVIVDYDLNVTAGYIIFGNLKIFQWGTVTTVAGEATGNVLPIAFTSSNIQYSAQPTTMPAGAGDLVIANICKTAASPLTQFDIRAGLTNWTTGPGGAHAGAFRWSANGQ